ncbi:PD-(D/E)XK nuclease family protein [Chenggangzhangella methanolivorans]|uniref:PD-(D/E)XK nuclease family protein n=1 Tax=Chenggangzhangella methanolivorans TaxID=1437009 RepID=UPI003621AA0F
MARGRALGTNILTIESAVARLAGGFSRPVDPIELRQAVAEAIETTALGELEPIKMLPGVPSAAAASLMKLWRAGVELDGAEAPRLLDMAAIEAAVMERLPASALRPQDLVAQALGRVAHAKSCFGPVTIKGMTELEPIWRPLLIELAKVVPVTWEAGPREVPAWLEGTPIKVERSEPHQPEVSVVSCATARHEVVEAFRWVRELIASGAARPEEIAIAAASVEDYEDHFNAIAADANIGVHAVSGIKALQTGEGQAAAALADILLRGVNQKRVRRLFGLARPDGLSDEWARSIPRASAMSDMARWRQAYAVEGAEADGAILLPLLEMLDRGVEAAEDAGERILEGRALLIWRRALETGPVEALDSTVQDLKTPDGLDPMTSPIFVAAKDLVTTPRRFVRLIGLSSRGWPRGTGEDALVPEHVVRAAVLNPLPLVEADRRDFRTIMVTTSGSVTFSYPRRDAEGRALGRSPLVPDQPVEHLRRSRIPTAAMSESDRVFARADEFASTRIAVSARACWGNWHSEEMTAHDGLVRANHPRIVAALNDPQSARSLTMMLRNPIAYLWTYGLRIQEPDDDSEPLTVDNLSYGNLVHNVLERAVAQLEADGGAARATTDDVGTAISSAVATVAAEYEADNPLPPNLIWRRTLDDVGEVSLGALSNTPEPLIGQRSYVEVPFGGETPVPGVNYPWNIAAEVTIPGTDIKLRGRMDRVDLSGNGAQVNVTDYKTGSLPKKPNELVLNGGKELQRCLYDFTVKALLGDVEVTASLNYPRAQAILPLPEPVETLEKLKGYLVIAKANLLAGRAPAGKDAAGDYDGLRFALPANAKAAYLNRKEVAMLETVGPLAAVWDEK